MPGRAIFNNCIFFVTSVRKIASKKVLTPEETETKKLASVVASLSSNHSWKTYKYLHDYSDLDKEALASELSSAFAHKWKNISEIDVEEVVKANYNPQALSSLIFYVVDKGKRTEYRELFSRLKDNFIYTAENNK